MHMHMVFAYPIQPHQVSEAPAAPRALSFLYVIVTTNAAKGAGHGKALFSSAREAVGILK